MDVYELMKSRRTVRLFQPKPIPDETLSRMVDAARLAPSGANLQPIRYLVVTDEELKAKVFATCKWAAYINPERDPEPGQEPTAYVIFLIEESVANKAIVNYDVGLSCENLLITGLAEGVGGCLLLNFGRKEVKEIFDLPDNLTPNIVAALGYPAEEPVYVDNSESPKYWLDEGGVLNVPKVPLDEVMFLNGVKK